MPTYEYECEDCQHNFTMFQAIKEERLKECPKCSGNLKRVVGFGSGLIFKGKGFPTNDMSKRQ